MVWNYGKQWPGCKERNSRGKSLRVRVSRYAIIRIIDVHCFIERWIKAPLEVPDGKIIISESGVPQGGVISPILSNLYLHYVFDKWMTRLYSKD